MPAARRVLYVANAAKIGGGAKVLMDLMQHLDPARFAPVLVAPGPGALVDWALTNDIPHYLCAEGDWSSRTGLMRRSLQLMGIIARSMPQLVHAAAPMCYRALGVAAGLARVPRICHLGFPPEEGELQRGFVAGPEAVIGCYEQQATEQAALIHRIRPDCRVIGIPNGIDVERFRPTGPADEDCLRWRFGARQVVAILGHVSEVKGYPAFIDAAALINQALPDTAFVAIGGETTQQGFRNEVLSHAARLGIQDRLHLIGFQDQVAPILRAVDVVTLPSLAEGFPLAALEAMACGKPVVASDVGGVPEAIVDGQHGLLIPPASPRMLADAVLGLLTNPDRAQALGAAARRRVQDHFTVEKFAARVQELYGSLLHERTSSISVAAEQL